MKPDLKFMLAFGLALATLHCGGDKLDAEGAGGSLGSIAVSAVDADGQVDVIIPDSFFGDTLADGSFDVALNDVAVGTDLDPSDSSLHDSDAEVVAFSLDSISEGDEITLTITDSEGDVGTYSAVVSDEATFAVSAD